MSMKAIVIGVIVTLTLFAGGFYIYNSSDDEMDDEIETTQQDSQATETVEPAPTQTEAAPAPATINVVYDQNGYSPSNITIRQGDTVNFINNSSVPLWPASDPHPDHTVLPEFDRGKVEQALPKAGEGYEFTFNTVGVWPYHNHTAPDHSGVITVEPR